MLEAYRESNKENISEIEMVEKIELGELNLGLLVKELEDDLGTQVENIEDESDKLEASKAFAEFKSKSSKILLDYILIAALSTPVFAKAEGVHEEDFINYDDPQQTELITNAIEDLKDKVLSDNFETMHQFYGRKEGRMAHYSASGEDGAPYIRAEKPSEYINDYRKIHFDSGENSFIQTTIHNHPASVLKGLDEKYGFDENKIDKSLTAVAPPSGTDIFLDMSAFNNVRAYNYVVDSTGVWKYELDYNNENVKKYAQENVGEKIWQRLHEKSLTEDDVSIFFEKEMGKEFSDNFKKFNALHLEIIKKSLDGENVDHLIQDYIKISYEVGYIISYQKNTGTLIEKEDNKVGQQLNDIFGQ